MARDQIRYDLLTQDALRYVIRRVLTDVARDGVLPGKHHFYISFRTGDPGVRLSQRMRSTYPEEMTIVLQNQFWDLKVNDNAFEVGLAFGGIPENLLIPFASVTGFFDPSVEFAIKFESGFETEGEDESETALPEDETGQVMKLGDARDRTETTLPGASVGKSDEDDTPPPAGSGEVVQLDRFRKKT